MNQVRGEVTKGIQVDSIGEAAGEVQRISLDALILDPRCQARVAFDPATIEEYAEAQADLPPIDVWRLHGAEDGADLLIVDGFHRFAAFKDAGVSFCAIRIVGEGDIEEASWYAASVNQCHGLKRSPDDKRHAIRLALDSAIGVEQGNRAIAEHCGVHHDTVKAVRAEVDGLQLANSPPDDPPKKRKGKDGKFYPASRVVPDTDQGDAPDEVPNLQVSAGDIAEAPASIAGEQATRLCGYPAYQGALERCAEQLRRIRRELIGDPNLKGLDLATQLRAPITTAIHRVEADICQPCPTCHDGPIPPDCPSCKGRGIVRGERAAAIEQARKRSEKGAK